MISFRKQFLKTVVFVHLLLDIVLIDFKMVKFIKKFIKI